MCFGLLGMLLICWCFCGLIYDWFCLVVDDDVLCFVSVLYVYALMGMWFLYVLQLLIRCGLLFCFV